jgi:HD-GYP domain-containing protein (c-di-GMP phosphodiesterase class II)
MVPVSALCSAEERDPMAEKNVATTGHEKLQKIKETAQLVLALLGAKDSRLREHSERVANTSANFASCCGIMRDDELEHLHLAGLLHDTGCISMAAELLDPTHSASEEELLLVKRHPVVGVDLLSRYPPFEVILESVRHHHEAFDGSGYPDGQKGDEIPLAARILHLCDAYDKLTSAGRAGKGLSRDDALSEIRSQAAREFDPDLVAKFIEYLQVEAGSREDFLAKKQAVSIKQAFAGILQKFSAGKIVPPAMSQVVLELRKVIKRQDSSVKDLADVLEKDPVISLRLISVAKCPLYKGYGEVKTIQMAIPRLGFKETLSIVVAISNKSLYEIKHPQHRVLLDKMWVHSLATAYTAKLIGQGLLLDEPESLFILGLTHDVGKVILLRAFAEIQEDKNLNADLIVSAIQDAHQSIGVMLVKRWGFGDEFARAISQHEGSNFNAQTQKEILVVHLANLMTRKMGFSFFEWDQSDVAAIPSAVLLGVSAEMISKIEAKVSEIIRGVAHLF